MHQRYYKWCILIKKITNFQSIDHVAGLEFSGYDYPDEDYVVGGDGYLLNEHKELLNEKENRKEKEKELCVDARDAGLDYRSGRIYISVDENWIAVEGSTRSIDYYGGFEYIDEGAKTVIGRYTFYEGECDRVRSAIEYYEQNLSKNNEDEQQQGEKS
mgnify:CR=1 FL=1